MAEPQFVSSGQLDSEGIEIRLKDIKDFFYTNRRLILLGALIGLILGCIYAFSKPNVYTAQVTVLPEVQSSGGSNLGGLSSIAGLAGINLDNMAGQDAIRPDLYPTVLQSIPFALHLLKQPVYSELMEAKLTLQEFIKNFGSAGILFKLGSMFSVGNKKTGDVVRQDPRNFSQAIQITKEQDELIKGIQQSVSATYEKKTGIITITAIEPDPVVAATIARLSLEYLTNYVTNYRTGKARKQVQFLTQQIAIARQRYEETEIQLSNYRDRNRSLFLNRAKIEEQRLQADYLLAQSVYNDLSKQLEQARIKVEEESPVFQVLEPARVPLYKSGPKRLITIIGFSIFGLLLGLAVSIIRHFM